MILRKRYFNVLLYEITTDDANTPRQVNRRQAEEQKKKQIFKRAFVYFLCNTEIILYVIFSELTGREDLGLLTLFETECLVYLLVFPLCVLTFKRIERRGTIGSQTTLFCLIGSAG